MSNIKTLRESAIADLSSAFDKLHSAAHQGDAGIPGVLNSLMMLTAQIPDGGREASAKMSAKFQGAAGATHSIAPRRLNTKAPLYGDIKEMVAQVEISEESRKPKNLTAAPYEVGVAGKTSPDAAEVEQNPENLDDMEETTQENESSEASERLESSNYDALLEMDEEDLKEELLEMGAEEIATLLKIDQIREIHKLLTGEVAPSKNSKVAQARTLISLLDD